MILALGPQCFSMTTGLCGTAVLGQVCSFLQLLFNYCLLFMVTEGFPQASAGSWYWCRY